MSLQYNKETILWSCTSHLIIHNVCKFQDGRRSRAVFSNFLLNCYRLPWKMQCALVLQTMVSDTGMDINSIPVQIKGKKPWRKVLYEDQGVPDNYVDESFLDEMRKNLNTRTYQFWSVVLESGAVSQQLSSVSIFVAAFVYMDLGLLSPSILVVLSSVLTLVGYVLFDALDNGTLRQQSKRMRLDDLKSCVLVLVSVLLSSPVLKTLTDSISTDTIYAMTSFMLAMNLLLYDYGTRAAIVSRSTSLNASIFASVCLASRLPSSWHVFATVILAMQMFALFPSFRRQLKMHLPSSDIFLTWTLVFVAIAMLWPLTQLFAVLLVLVHLAVTLVCPFWLIKLQRLKNNIHGPWDEAVIRDEHVAT